MSVIKNVQRAVLPLVFLAAGAFGARTIMGMGEEAERSDVDAPPIVVETVEALVGSYPVQIEATGAVQASSSVNIVPEVSGRIVEVARGLTPGMKFSKGDVIAEIDGRDYRSNVIQAKSTVSSAELDLAIEEQRGGQAVREWELLGRNGDNPLAMRRPHLAAAQARVDAAKSALNAAYRAVERTTLKAPFDGIVTAESLEVGTYVTPGAPVATLMGTDRFRVRVQVPIDDLPLIDIPDVNGSSASTAIITQRLADGTTLERKGEVLRLLSELDEETRTATVLVAIDDPMSGGYIPILPGAYVDVTLVGRNIDNVVAIPREALANGNTVWVAAETDETIELEDPVETEDGDETEEGEETEEAEPPVRTGPKRVLAQRNPVIAWSGRTYAYATEGFEIGDGIIVSPLSLPVIGREVSVVTQTAAAE